MIRKETKKNIFDHLDMEEIDFSGRMDNIKFLSRLYDLEKLPSYDDRYENALQDIAQHSVWNNDYERNWPFEQERFQLYEDDVKFLRFICDMAHPLVRSDVNQAQRIVTIANDWMKEEGWEIYPIREIAGGKVYGFRETNIVIKPSDDEVSKIWEPNLLRFFISHRDAHKRCAAQLGEELRPYGISSFVAHDNIESNSIWKNEILKALLTMDACICYVTPDFHDSVWTNQEVGYALAKGVPIYFYSIDGAIHKGFRYDQQAFKKGFNDLIDGIKKDFQGHPQYKRSFIDSFLAAKNGSWDNAKSKFFDLVGLEFSDREIEEIIEAFFAKAKYSNQLRTILYDEIKPEHKLHPKLRPYTHYWQYLDDHILRKHSGQGFRIENNQIKGIVS